jgi:hypothetical protein
VGSQTEPCRCGSCHIAVGGPTRKNAAEARIKGDEEGEEVGCGKDGEKPQEQGQRLVPVPGWKRVAMQGRCRRLPQIV